LGHYGDSSLNLTWHKYTLVVELRHTILWEIWILRTIARIVIKWKEVY